MADSDKVLPFVRYVIPSPTIIETLTCRFATEWSVELAFRIKRRISSNQVYGIGIHTTHNPKVIVDVQDAICGGGGDLVILGFGSMSVFPYLGDKVFVPKAFLIHPSNDFLHLGERVQTAKVVPTRELA